MRNKNTSKLFLAFAMFAALAFGQTVPDTSPRTWERKQLQELHSIEQGSYSTKEAVTKSLDIALSASNAGMKRVVHNALGAAVLRADAKHCNAIISFVSSNEAIRRSILPFAEELYAKSGNDATLIELLSEIAQEPHDGETGDCQVRAVRSIARITNDPKMLRSLLLPVVKIVPPTLASYEAASKVAPFVERQDWPRLRRIAIAHLSKNKYHPAVDVLSFHADETLLPLLDKLAIATRRDEHARLSRILRARWRIEAQSPPENLITLIDSEDARDRTWLVERAMGLDLDGTAIRKAVLRYLRQHSAAPDAASVSDISRRLGVITNAEARATTAGE